MARKHGKAKKANSIYVGCALDDESGKAIIAFQGAANGIYGLQNIKRSIGDDNRAAIALTIGITKILHEMKGQGSQITLYLANRSLVNALDQDSRDVMPVHRQIGRISVSKSNSPPLHALMNTLAEMENYHIRSEYIETDPDKREKMNGSLSERDEKKYARLVNAYEAADKALRRGNIERDAKKERHKEKKVRRRSNPRVADAMQLLEDAARERGEDTADFDTLEANAG